MESLSEITSQSTVEVEEAPTDPARLLAPKPQSSPKRATFRRSFKQSDLIRAIRSAQMVSKDFVVRVNSGAGYIEISAQSENSTALGPVDRAEAELLELARRHGYD